MKAKLTEILQNSKIDSICIELPLRLDQNPSNPVGRKTTSILDETGEIFEQKILKSRRIEHNHITTGTKLKSQIQNDARAKTDKKFIAEEPMQKIAIPAKLAGNKYLQGITENNLEEIHHNWQKIPGTAKYTFHQFLTAKITDTDYAFDFITEDDTYKNIIREIEQRIDQTQKHKINIFRTENKYGFEFQTRQKATIARPYIKMYDKEKEMQIMHSLFLKHNKITIPANTKRLELTMRESKQYVYHSIPAPRTILEAIQTTTEINKKALQIISNAMKLDLIEKPERKPIIQFDMKEEIIKQFITEKILTTHTTIKDQELLIDQIIKSLLERSGYQPNSRVVRKWKKFYTDMFEEIRQEIRQKNDVINQLKMKL